MYIFYVPVYKTSIASLNSIMHILQVNNTLRKLQGLQVKVFAQFASKVSFLKAPGSYPGVGWPPVNRLLCPREHTSVRYFFAKFY